MTEPNNLTNPAAVNPANPSDPTPPAPKPAEPPAPPAKPSGLAEPAAPTPAANTYTKEQMDAAVAEAVKEAEELAKLDVAEREKKLREKSDQELAALKAQVADKELGEYAAKQLEAAKLPQSLLPYLKGEDEKSTDARITEFGKIYKEAVDAGVEERFKAIGNHRAVPANQSTAKPTDEPVRRRGVQFLGRR